MRLLLDTHAFLWFSEGSSNLSLTARTLIEDENNQSFLSVVSLWEIAIKVGIGKLKIGMTFDEFVQRQVYENAIDLLEIQPKHLDALAQLPFHHKDPFDRLLIAQSLTEPMPVVTRDSAFRDYHVSLIW